MVRLRLCAGRARHRGVARWTPHRDRALLRWIRADDATGAHRDSTRAGHLVGDPIAAFLPELHHAIRWEEAPQFRASLQCLGHRGNGESFAASVWFSTYKEGSTPKLAAIIADVTEEQTAASTFAAPGLSASPPATQREGAALNDRETAVLRLVVQGRANKEIAAHMDISESAVKNTIQQLFAKTGVRTRSQLVRVALEQYRNSL